MPEEYALSFYLALLSVQMAILGVVVAGIVALMQMLHKARPRRVMRLLIRRRVLYGYILFLAVVLLAICLATWAIAFDIEGFKRFFMRSEIGALLIIYCLGGLFGFVYLVYRTRTLLEADQYLTAYIPSVPKQKVREYLFRWYSTRPEAFDPDEQPAVDKKEVQRLQKASQAELAAYDARFTQASRISDQFQPIREYLKDNAFNSYDSGTAAGLRFFGILFNDVFAAISKNPQPGEFYYLARYLADSCEEFYAIFRKTSSEKRQADTIRLVADKAGMFVSVKDAEGLLTLIRCLEELAKRADDEDEVILCIESIRALTDQYLALHKNAHWDDIAHIFEEACLSVTRLAEHYYLLKENPLRTVPIIGHYRNENRTVTSVLVDFFGSYDDLGERYPDAYPVRYFEAIEAVLEALFASYGEIVAAGHERRGLNLSYSQFAAKLYRMYLEFGIDAIEHRKADLFALSLTNARRILKAAKHFNLRYEQGELTALMLELYVKGVAPFSHAVIKDNRTLEAFVRETLQKHSSKALTAEALAKLEERGVDTQNVVKWA